MVWEKPWNKPFEELLQQILQHYKGQISGTDFKKYDSSRSIDPSYFVYPTFQGELEEQKFMIEVSEFPTFRIDCLGTLETCFETADNIEYLRISIIKPTQYSIVVTHEDWFHRLKRKLRLDHEFQTGHDEFDRKYYLNLKSDRDKELLGNSKFQELVRNLEPFSVLLVSKPGIIWSQNISYEKQLSFPAVDGYLKKMFELASVIPNK